MREITIQHLENYENLERTRDEITIRLRNPKNVYDSDSITVHVEEFKRLRDEMVKFEIKYAKPNDN